MGSEHASPMASERGDFGLRRFETVPANNSSGPPAEFPKGMGHRTPSGRSLSTWVSSYDSKTLESEQRHSSRLVDAIPADAPHAGPAAGPAVAPPARCSPRPPPVLLQAGVVPPAENSPFSSASLLATVLTGF